MHERIRVGEAFLLFGGSAVEFEPEGYVGSKEAKSLIENDEGFAVVEDKAHFSVMRTFGVDVQHQCYSESAGEKFQDFRAARLFAPVVIDEILRPILAIVGIAKGACRQA